MMAKAYLNMLSVEINTLYGYVKIPDDSFGEPTINAGSFGPHLVVFSIK